MTQQPVDGIGQRAGPYAVLQILEGLQRLLPQGLGFPMGLLCPGAAHGGIDPDDNVFDRPAGCLQVADGLGGHLAQPCGMGGAGNHHGHPRSLDTGHANMPGQGRWHRCSHGRLRSQQFVGGLQQARALRMMAQPVQCGHSRGTAAMIWGHGDKGMNG